MKSIKTLVVVSVLSLISFSSFAQSVSVTSSTLASAEAEIAAQAQQHGDQYKITSVNSNNRVYMTAQLYK